jgi:hypothetical protein
MASIIKQPNGYRILQFKSPDGKRKTVHLGKTTQKNAQSIKAHVENILSALRSKTSIADEEARWLAEVPDDLADKLAAVGIGRARQAATLAAFCESYLTGRTDLKASSRIAYGTHRDRIVSFFGADKPLRDITEGDADNFAVHLRGKFAQATMGRTIKVAKQLFRAARRRKLISEDPFADAKGTPQTNEARKVFITVDDTDLVLRACPDAEYRLIVALSRFGGLRCPSETLALKRRGLGKGPHPCSQPQDRTSSRRRGKVDSTFPGIAATPGRGIRQSRAGQRLRYHQLPRREEKLPHAVPSHHQPRRADALAQAVSQSPRQPRDGTGG